MAEETGITHVADPLAGSCLLEALTAQLAEEARKRLEEVESVGGMTTAVASGMPKLRIEETPARNPRPCSPVKQPARWRDCSRAARRAKRQCSGVSHRRGDPRLRTGERGADFCDKFLAGIGFASKRAREISGQSFF